MLIKRVAVQILPGPLFPDDMCAPVCEKPSFLFMVASNLIWADPTLLDHPTSCQTRAKFAFAAQPESLWPFTMAVKVQTGEKGRETLVKICISSIGKRGVVHDYCHIHPAHNYIASRCKQRQVYDLYCGILWYYNLYCCGIFAKPERFYAVVTYFMLGSIEMYTASLGPQVSHNLS